MKPKSTSLGRRWYRLVAATLALASACAAAQTPAPFISDAQLVTALAQRFSVHYATLARQATDLRGAIEALCADPAKSEKLEAARSAWRAAARTVRVIEAWPVGPTLERRSLPRIDFWPTRPPQIEAAIVEQGQGTLDLAKVGVTAQGLPALEYLLFDPASRGAPVLASPAHCAYALRVASEVSAEATDMNTAWSDWTKRGEIASDAAKANALVGDTLNVVVAALNQMRGRKLQRPAPTSTSAMTTRAVPTWDAWRSGATREHLLANLEGVRAVLVGEADSPGLLALLRGRGYLAIASQLDQRLIQAEEAVRALPNDLRNASARAGAAAIQAIAQLQEGLAADAATALKVTMGFNDSDGD